MGFPKTYESRIQTELHQLVVHYDKNKWIHYKVSRANKHNGLKTTTHSDNPRKAGMFETMGMVVGFLDSRGSHSDSNDHELVINENVSKNRINDLVAEIEQYSKKYLTE